jgi:putative ABC transport system substrate-binding protein
MKLTLIAITVAVFALFAAPLATAGQQARKVWRIGYLTAASAEIEKSRLAGFQQGLRELGYVEGESIVLEQRYGAGRSARLLELAAELVRLKVDVLVVGGDVAALAAKKTTSAIPIVMITIADPVGIGLVASLARPGGNVTGLSDLHADLVPKRLQLLRDVVPSASRLAVMSNPANPAHPLQLKDIQAAAPALRVTLLSLEIKGPDDIDRAFATIGKERPGGLLVLGDRMLGTHRKRIAALAFQSRLPAIVTNKEWVETEGLLMSYGADFTDQFRRAATYVDKILKGATPADLPVEQPTRFELVINLKTARALGLTIPPSVLLRANQVIE